MKKIKAVVLVLIMILCGAAFARGLQDEGERGCCRLYV